MDCKKRVYLLLPIFFAFAFFAGRISYADVDVPAPSKPAAGIDREALKAELKKELKAELIEELRAEMLSEARADIQRATEEATAGIAERAAEEASAGLKADIASQVSNALEETGILGGMFKGTTVGGFIDVNYMYNLRNHGEGSGGTRGGGDFQSSGRNANDAINFVGENEDNSFTLENFALFMDKPTTDESPIGWQMHTYWGEKAQRITFAGPGNDTAASDAGAAGENDRFAIATANITWDVPVAGRRVPVTIGKMYTWIGYELVENIGNPNYTHGTVYNNAIPFTHTGMSFDVSEFLPSDKLGLTLYFVNGWDSYIDNNEAKSWGTYLTWQPNDDFFISLATIHGGEGDIFGNRRDNGDVTQMYDIVATYALPQVEKLSLGFNFDWGQTEDLIRTATAESTAHWWAAVGYAMYDYTDNQQGAFRYEYFDNTDGAKAPIIGPGGSMYTLTYTHNIKIHENVLLRPEIRYNKYAIPSTPGADDPLTPGDKGNTADDEFIIGIGAEYVF